jgi:3,4-dihydroxy 2-butanone 4-phosphate synthase/GTP cyclohydrolase II
MKELTNLSAGLPGRLAEALGRAGEICRRKGRPLVTLSYAQSLDGSLTTRRGRPLALSGPESMALTHRLRAAHSALLVGIGTLLADDPSLTVRYAEGPSPQPVILDSGLRFPLEARVLHLHPLKPWIATSANPDLERQAALEGAGARLLCLPASPAGGLDLNALLRTLAEMGVDSLMVEGGARVIASFLQSGLVDQVMLTVAPVYVGGLNALEPEEAGPRLAVPLRLKNPDYARCGDDVIIWGDLESEARQG